MLRGRFKSVMNDDALRFYGAVSKKKRTASHRPNTPIEAKSYKRHIYNREGFSCGWEGGGVYRCRFRTISFGIRLGEGGPHPIHQRPATLRSESLFPRPYKALYQAPLLFYLECYSVFPSLCWPPFLGSKYRAGPQAKKSLKSPAGERKS